MNQYYRRDFVDISYLIGPQISTRTRSTLWNTEVTQFAMLYQTQEAYIESCSPKKSNCLDCHFSVSNVRHPIQIFDDSKNSM